MTHRVETDTKLRVSE